MKPATDEQMVAITEWLNTQGHYFDMRDGQWMEDYLQDFKWRDIFDMMVSWHERQSEIEARE